MSQEIVSQKNFFPLSELERMAAIMAKSNLFGIKTVEQAAALMLLAQAEGRHPATVAQEYNIILGKPALKSEALLARFIEAGGRVKWIESTDKRCEAVFSHDQGGEINIVWTIEMAKTANLSNKEIWKSYPRQMLRSRTASEGSRAVCPSICLGVYTEEEVGDFVQNNPKNTEYTEVKEQPSLPALPESELKGLRAKVNKSLTAKKTLLELQEFTNHFSEITSLKGNIWDALTGHNDSETFQSLYNEHLKRVEQHEFRISPEGIDNWIEELNKCETAEKYKVFECSFNKNDYLQIPKVCDALAVKRSELGLEDENEAV